MLWNIVILIYFGIRMNVFLNVNVMVVENFKLFVSYIFVKRNYLGLLLILWMFFNFIYMVLVKY